MTIGASHQIRRFPYQDQGGYHQRLWFRCYGCRMYQIHDAEATGLKAVDIVDQALSYVERAQWSVYRWNGWLCNCLYGDELLAGAQNGVIHMYYLNTHKASSRSRCIQRYPRVRLIHSRTYPLYWLNSSSCMVFCSIWRMLVFVLKEKDNTLKR